MDRVFLLLVERSANEWTTNTLLDQVHSAAGEKDCSDNRPRNSYN